jgi:hypothetical protein
LLNRFAQDQRHNQGPTHQEIRRGRILSPDGCTDGSVQAYIGHGGGSEHDQEGRPMRLWKGKEVLQVLACLRSFINRDDPRRKECCHPLDAGDLFKYMSALIKVSNHLALILPGEPRCIRNTSGHSLFFYLQHLRTLGNR